MYKCKAINTINNSNNNKTINRILTELLLLLLSSLSFEKFNINYYKNNNLLIKLLYNLLLYIGSFWQRHNQNPIIIATIKTHCYCIVVA